MQQREEAYHYAVQVATYSISTNRLQVILGSQVQQDVPTVRKSIGQLLEADDTKDTNKDAC